MKLRLLDIGIALGKKCITNEYYIEHFREQDKDVAHLFNDVMKKKKRYISEDKNSVVLGIEAAQKALEINGLSGKDIDIIIFASSLPEVLSPPCSVLLHRSIDGKENALCFDINVNCSGMVTGMQLATTHLNGNDTYHRALIIGSDYLNVIADPTNELCYGHYGDASCAVIMEKCEGDSEIIAYNAMVDNNYCTMVGFPRKGFSKLAKSEDIVKEDLFIRWEKFKIEGFATLALKQIRKVLEDAKMTVKDIDAVCFSQVSYRNNMYILETLGIDKEKDIYIGDKYGYTGASSPLLAFYEGVKSKKIKRGDVVLIWTIGMGAQGVCMLLKY